MTADSRVASAMPAHMLRPNEISKALGTRAPMPTNRLCASDIWPAKPPTMFQASASPTNTSVCVAMPR